MTCGSRSSRSWSFGVFECLFVFGITRALILEAMLFLLFIGVLACSISDEGWSKLYCFFILGI
jgi:hypothetical protein